MNNNLKKEIRLMILSTKLFKKINLLWNKSLIKDNYVRRLWFNLKLKNKTKQKESKNFIYFIKTFLFKGDF